MKILLALDSFKGSLSSKLAGECLAKGIRAQNTAFSTEVLTVADGGEGSLEMLAAGKTEHRFTAAGPLGRKVQGYYLSHGTTAYLEMAVTCGLTLLKKEEYNPLLTSTYGLGQNLRKAAGFRRVIIFAGGSATHDAGLGALHALGFRFLNKNGREIIPAGGNLKDIRSFQRPENLNLPEIWVATDVSNPFYGKKGTTVYAAQKGATPAMRKTLEAGIKNIASLFPDVPVQEIPGAGAAGGLAGGFHLFLGARIVPATTLLFEEAGLAARVSRADIVVTGEGRIDAQTLHGKLVSRILALSPEKKFILVAGRIERELRSPAVLEQFSLTAGGMPAEEAMRQARRLMVKQGRELAKFLENKFG